MMEKVLILAHMAAAFSTEEDDVNELVVSETEAIQRLCKLMSDVRDHLGGPADCFCPGTFRDPHGYRNDGRSIDFIERAVRAELGKEVKP